MLKFVSISMDSKIAMFAVLAFAAVFAMMTPMDFAVAESTTATPDGEGEDGEHKGKSCPVTGKIKASIIPGIGI